MLGHSSIVLAVDTYTGVSACSAHQAAEATAGLVLRAAQQTARTVRGTVAPAQAIWNPHHTISDCTKGRAAERFRCVGAVPDIGDVQRYDFDPARPHAWLKQVTAAPSAPHRVRNPARGRWDGVHFRPHPRSTPTGKIP